MNTFFKFTLLKITIALFLVIHKTSGQQAQYFTLWNATVCTGNAFANATASNNYTIPPGTTGTIYFKLNGLWAIEMCNATACSSRAVQPGVHTGCSQISRGGLNNTRVRLTRFGDPNQIETRIHLFPEQYLQGTPIIVDQNGANFSTITARSCYFTGLNEWGYKLNANAAGSSCLNYTTSVRDRGYGITYLPTSNIQVGSVKRGCNTTTTTTPRPNMTTRKSSASKLVEYFVLIPIVTVLTAVRELY